MTMQRWTPEERFWSKVDKNGPVPEHRHDLGPCWVWTAGKDGAGYGKFNFTVAGKKKTWRAHRVAFVLAFGSPPPEKPYVCHRCDNPPCVRPDHLFAGSAQDNTDDAIEKLRKSVLSEKSWRMFEYYVQGRSIRQTAVFYGVDESAVLHAIESCQKRLARAF